MKTIVTESHVRDMFRELRPNNFTYDGLTLLFDWIDNEELETDEDYLINVVDICMLWTEYENFKEIKENYSDIETMEDLEENTTVLYNFQKICNNASCNHENHKMEDVENFPIVIRNY